MWDMYSGVKANEKHDGGTVKIIGSSGDPLLTPYRPLTGLKFCFWIWARGVCNIINILDLHLMLQPHHTFNIKIMLLMLK